ncbi:hypothetical protein EDC94DRAFT_605420 [Helicostylum pulchrum]|nr:hypothetical protein EDC94DRAFT_605420 [Helicostylum pulchrum]
MLKAILRCSVHIFAVLMNMSLALLFKLSLQIRNAITSILSNCGLDFYNFYDFSQSIYIKTSISKHQSNLNI